ncbi:tumor necrosis factor receptor superfamily member 6-like isoform X2 [Gouania willdenowi]|uniref:tumor necrosis factor receptor superfamily member 6-like isoform X2 n=1 Tax=Gouania willdenowi TaxID=441366 RepID=UPI0010555CFA|nr:tumor necrosis factor receptor superfamily member 6-like isoform X2 [Gouania willdenowi]
MKRHLQVVFYICSIWLLTSGSAFYTGSIRQRRNADCRENTYLHENLCCLNCPAGTYLKSPCTRSGERGQCEECNYGSFTEHANALPLCLKCTQCRHDQEVVRPCTFTQDAECQCKPGVFCDPDQACEVCKKCSRCKDGEEAVRNCTSTTNTECKKTQTNSDYVVLCAVLSVLSVLVVLIVGGIFFFCKRRNKTADSQRTNNMKSESIYSHAADGSSEEEPRRLSGTNLSLSLQLVRAKPLASVEEECKMLCESLNSSASNSQHSLTYLPPSSSSSSFAAFAAPTPAPRAQPPALWRPDKRDEDRFPKLKAVKGEDSLRACFGYFEELSMNCYKRFFRSLGISDNVIKGKEQLPYEDRVHELLNVWVEKKGRDASLNDLLRALLELDQKYTAETIQQRALSDGHYLCEGQEEVGF